MSTLRPRPYGGRPAAAGRQSGTLLLCAGRDPGHRGPRLLSQGTAKPVLGVRRPGPLPVVWGVPGWCGFGDLPTQGSFHVS